MCLIQRVFSFSTVFPVFYCSSICFVPHCLSLQDHIVYLIVTICFLPRIKKSWLGYAFCNSSEVKCLKKFVFVGVLICFLYCYCCILSQSSFRPRVSTPQGLMGFSAVLFLIFHQLCPGHKPRHRQKDMQEHINTHLSWSDFYLFVLTPSSFCVLNI